MTADDAGTSDGECPEDDRGVPEDAHLDDLGFRGFGDSGGRYRPSGFDLRLSGEEIGDRLTYIHETHHASLNDSTAWGALLHVVARIPADANAPAYRPLVDACRLVHEAYATFASLSIIEANHGPQPAALAAYPQYLPLQRRLATLVAAGGGQHRQYLLATAVARCCMQSPVLALVAAEGLVGFCLSDLRSLDTPDGRYRALLRMKGDVSALAAEAGDAATGWSAVDLDRIDGTDPLEATDDAHDEMWGLWEEAAYDEIAQAIAGMGATSVAYNGHQEWTGELVAVAERTWGRLGLVAASLLAPATDDRSIAEAMLAQVRHELVDEPYAARMLEVDIVAVAALVAEHARIGGLPVLIVDARLPERLLSSYRWPADDAAWLGERTEPVVGVRLIGSDEAGGSEIVLIPVTSADDLQRLVAAWADRGPVAASIAASCLIDVAWQRDWWGRFARSLRTIVLIDIEPARLTRSWAASGSPVRVGRVAVEDTAGHWQGLAVEAGGGALWLGLGEQITVNFLHHALVGAIDVEEGTEFLTAWAEPMRVVITHLLATETYLDFAGLEARL
jgi:hypothetical protein